MAKTKKKANNVGKRLPNIGSFKKGDPRCHRSGQVSKKKLQFNKALNELLVAEGERESTGKIGEKILKMKNVEWLVKSVWKNAINGESWAVNFIADRVEGKVTQPFGGDPDKPMAVRLILEEGNSNSPAKGNDKNNQGEEKK